MVAVVISTRWPQSWLIHATIILYLLHRKYSVALLLLSMHKKIPVTPDSMRCSTCMLSEFCLSFGLSMSELEQLDALVQERIRLPKNSTLFQLGDPADAIYALRSGSLKTQLEDASGHVQITSFLLPGEIVGIDGLQTDIHRSHAIALEDSEVCVMRMNDFDRLATEMPVLQTQLRRLMSQEIARSHNLMKTLGALRSEQRLAAFLLNLSERLSALGYSPYEFILRMSREEIGNFLGLTLETVSRLFSRFAREGLLKIQQREVMLLDLDALRELSGVECAAEHPK